MLNYNLGRRLSGGTCAADEAFHRMTWEIARIGDRATWRWFVDRVQALAAALAEAGGFDEAVADLVEAPEGFFGATEVVDRFLRASDICAEIEEAVVAFLVTMQPRLSAARSAANRVYRVAREIDGIDISTKGIQLPDKVQSVWNLTNYIKHNDEWGETLTDRQRKSFVTLLDLGVATETDGKRGFVRWPVSEAVAKIANEHSIVQAVPAIAELCAASCRQWEDLVQADFAKVGAAVEAVRSRNASARRTEQTTT